MKLALETLPRGTMVQRSFPRNMCFQCIWYKFFWESEMMWILLLEEKNEVPVFAWAVMMLIPTLSAIPTKDVPDVQNLYNVDLWICSQLCLMFVEFIFMSYNPLEKAGLFKSSFFSNCFWPRIHVSLILSRPVHVCFSVPMDSVGGGGGGEHLTEVKLKGLIYWW